MKKVLVITALATLLGSAAFAQEIDVAQSYNPQFGTGNVLPAPPSPAFGGALDARAQAPESVARGKRGKRLKNGKTDPDPNIRFQLYREQQEDVEGN